MLIITHRAPPENAKVRERVENGKGGEARKERNGEVKGRGGKRVKINVAAEGKNNQAFKCVKLKVC